MKHTVFSWRTFIICLFVVAVVAVVAFYAGSAYSTTTTTTTTTKSEDTGLFAHKLTTGPVFTVAEPFLSTTYVACPNDVSVSEQTSCVMNLAEKTKNEADAFADSLILKANEYKPASDGEVVNYMESFMKTVSQAKQQGDYVQNMCDLDTFAIYGGSGLNLEYAACQHYYYTLYFNLLKNLERESASYFTN
jgi:hypothetical protein